MVVRTASVPASLFSAANGENSSLPFSTNQRRDRFSQSRLEIGLTKDAGEVSGWSNQPKKQISIQSQTTGHEEAT